MNNSLMHFFVFISSSFGCLLQAEIEVCPHHKEEIHHIRNISANALSDAHKLTGDTIGSIVVTANDLAWNAVKQNNTYSDFSKTFQEAVAHCNKKGKFLASNRLYKGLNDTGDLFLILYDNCITNHHNFRSVFERGKIHFDRGNIEECLSDMDELLKEGLGDTLLKDVKPTDLLITKGQALLEIGNYEKAIVALTEAIKKDPKNKVAYFHRAAAYFETGNFDEAIKDYLMSDKGKGIPNSTVVASSSFTEALLKSTRQATIEAFVEFIPSTCKSTYGLSQTLWATHWSTNPLNPKASENLKNFANACYEIGESLIDYCKNIDEKKIDGYIDQIKIMYERVDQATDTEKGEFIGKIVGTYGVDILAGIGIVKGVQYANKSLKVFRSLRNANCTCNIEAMMESKAGEDVIVASALRHAKEREAFFNNLKYNFDAHNKHVFGHNDYDGLRSVWEHPDPEGLLKKFAGKGHPERGDPGKFGYKETVDFNEPIGIWKSEDGLQSITTTRGTIHYGKKGAHIVPARPISKIQNIEN